MYVAFNKTTSLLSKTFRIKKLYKYAGAEAKLATSIWLSCFICCDSLFWFGVCQEGLLVSYWSQPYLKQIKGQNAVLRTKPEKQILLLFHASAYAVLPTLVISVVCHALA